MANISVYAKRAKAIRRNHPQMSWQNAMKAAARGAVSKTKHRRRVSGTAVGTTAAVGRVTRRKHHHSPGIMGTSKINAGSLKSVAVVAAGMAGGFAAVHFGLRPLELKISRRYPMAAKFMAGAEILVGGVLVMKAKHPFVKAIGSGIMAAGVGGLLKQFNVHVETPAVSGVGEFTHVEIPVSGSDYMNGHGPRRHIYEGTRYHERPSNSNMVAGPDSYRTFLFS